MKKLFYAVAMSLGMIVTSCQKDNSPADVVSCDLPFTTVPSSIAGGWANGYNSKSQVIDIYNGQHPGNAWQSGRYFYFQNDGRHAELYYMHHAGADATVATRITGTVTFDVNESSFVFHGCEAHYRKWQNGTLVEDRDATVEVTGMLIGKYYYDLDITNEGSWLRVRHAPDSRPTSFRTVD